jgi:hypothetical protein
VEFYSNIKKNEILSFTDKWMELENSILNEVTHAQKSKRHMFSLICGLYTLYKYKQYYVKQVMLRGGHKKEVKEVNMVDVLSIQE